MYHFVFNPALMEFTSHHVKVIGFLVASVDDFAIFCVISNVGILARPCNDGIVHGLVGNALSNLVITHL